MASSSSSAAFPPPSNGNHADGGGVALSGLSHEYVEESRQFVQSVMSHSSGKGRLSACTQKEVFGIFQRLFSSEKFSMLLADNGYWGRLLVRRTTACLTQRERETEG